MAHLVALPCVAESLKKPRVAVAALILAISWAGVAFAQDTKSSVDAAEAWFVGQQSANGSYGDLDELKPRDTAQVVLALAGRESSADQVTRGAIYLSGVPEASAEFRALRALALAGAGQPSSALLDSLLDFGSGGGLGAFAGYQPNLYDSALAVQALAGEESRFLFQISALLDYVQLHQEIDGGWGLLAGASSELYYSAEMLDALAGLDQLIVSPAVLDGAAAYLISQQQADGGFGGVLETAVAYRALLAADRDPASYPQGSPVPYLLSRQAADGSWGGDEFTTAQVVRVLRSQVANLVIQDIAAPTHASPGSPILITVTVRNSSVETAAASRLELRAESADGAVLASAEIVELASGEEAVVELEVATDGLSGNLDVFAVADAADAIDEASEDDNVSSVRVTLRARPDLVLFAEDLALGTDPPAPGVVFDLLVSARNLGETSVTEFVYEVTRRVDGAADEVIATGATGPADAGAGVLVPVSLILEQGEQTLTVSLDPANAVEEESEANNQASLTFFVIDGEQADLAIADADLILNPAEPAGGGVVEVTVTVRNLGEREATSELILLENSSDSGGFGGGTELRRVAVTLEPGASEMITETVPLSVGAFALTAVVDPDGLVLETDETNNLGRRVFRDLPDLAIGFDNFEILTPAPLAGDPVALQLTVRNAGTEAAFDVPVEVFEGDPAAGGTPIFSTVLAEIPAAANRSVSLSWTASEGLLTLYAVADPSDSILEVSEDNNRFELDVAVPRASGPDLEIASVDLSSLAQSATDLSMAGLVTVQVANSGGDAATGEAFLVRLFEDRDGDGRFDGTDVSLGVVMVDSPLAIGATADVTFDIDANASFFHPLAWAEVDAGRTVAEIREDNNRVHLLGACRTAAPTADGSAPFEPVEEWALGGVEIESAPIVMQLTDDNGDGSIDSRDVPDIAFHTSDAQGSAIVAVSGLDGSRHWTFRSTPANPVLDFLGQLAAADLDGDGVVEVVGHQTNGRLLALRHDGQLLWVSDPVPGVGSRGVGGPVIGDLDGDGVPEIAYGRAVLSNTGTLIAVGTGNTGQNYNYYGLFGTVLPPGISSYPQSIIADIDVDGRNELVAGDTAYRLNGGDLEIVWNATVPDKLMVDGFSAVANLDSDPEAEIVYVSSNQIMVLNHDGSIRSSRRVMVPFSNFEMPTYWGGPPTVADLDGDGTPEILVVTATRLFAFNSGLGIRWQRSIQTDFGGVHTTTAFDFEGDGVREVLMLTEGTLYVLDGATGATRYSRPNISKTAMEFPVVADVDGDGRAEILVPSNTSFGGDSSTRGLHVLGHPSWRGTRPIWNQYGYHVSNVALDGTVPSPQQPPWALDNVYRANRQLPPPADLLMPNVSIGFPRVGAGGPGGIPVTVRVGNGGLAPLPAGVSVELYAGTVATGEPAVAGATSRGLLPGEWQDLVLNWTASSSGNEPVLAVIDAADEVDECDESDNEVAFVLTETLLPDLSIPSGGVTALSPVSAGQLVDIVVRVVNVGNAVAGATVVRFFDGPPASGDVLGEIPVASLGAGEEAQAVFTWDTFGDSGLRLIHVVVDPDGTLLELGLDNNAGLVAVEILPASLPDLTVESFTVTPASVDAGTPVLLTADVRNLGSRAESGVEVLFRANNGVVGSATVPGALDAGDVRSLQIELATQTYSGTVGLSARVDPNGVLPESNEGNNEATTSLTVQPRSVTVAVSLDRLSYGPEEIIAIELTLRNLRSADRVIDLVVQLVDSQGAVAAQFDQQTLTLGAGQTTVVGLEGTTGTHPAGSYSVVAEVSEAGILQTRGSALLTLSGEQAAGVSLLTDRDVYSPLQSAVLEGTVYNLSANTTIADATARLAVTSAAGAEVFSQERHLVSLFPSSSAPVNGVWEIAGADPGSYTASLSLRDAAASLIAYVETPIVVESSDDTGAGLSGSLTLPLDEIASGAPFVADFEVLNQGNGGISELELRFDLVRTDDGSLVQVVSRYLSLDRGASASGSVGFPSQGLPEGGYLISMVAVLPARETRLDRVALTLISGVSVFDATGFEGDSGSRQITFPVRLSSAQPVEVTVQFATADGSATAGSDYAPAGGLLTFAVGETEKNVAVTIFGDLDPESEETLLLRLTDASGISLGDGVALGVVIDEEGCGSRNLLANGDAEDAGATGELVGWTEGGGFERRFAEPPPLSGAAYLSVAVGAGAGELSQVVDLTPYASEIDASVPLFVIDGFVQVGAGDTARLITEYLDSAGLVVAGYDSGELTDSGGWLSVSDQRSVPAGTRSAKVRILGSGPGSEVAAYFDRLTLRSANVPTLTLAGVEILEGDVGNVVARLPLRLSCPTAVPLAVDVITSDDTARAGNDYDTVATTLFVPAGQDSLDVLADVTGDTLDEPTETFFVVPSTGDAVVLDTLATVTILDDDGPVLIEAHDLSVAEGDSAGIATVTVSLSGPSGKTATVQFHTEAGTAADGSDYSSRSGQLVFSPGTTELTLDVPILGDALDELDETFEVVLTHPTSASLGDARATVTLVDDDLVELSVNDVTVVEGDPNGTDTTVAEALFTVALSRPSVAAISVDFATADGLGADPAVAHSDYEPAAGTLTFEPGEVQTTVSVPILADLFREPEETFRLVLSMPTGGAGTPVLGDPESQALVIDDDGILISVADAVVVETPGFPINLARLYGAIPTPSSNWGNNPTYADYAIDGRIDTNWYPVQNDAVNRGGSPYMEVTLAAPSRVVGLRLFGNRSYANGYDYFSGIFTLYAVDGTVLWQTPDTPLPAPDRDIVFEFPAIDGVHRARFTSTGDESDHPGLSEFEVIGFSDYRNLSLDEGTTATAISSYSNGYLPQRALDGNLNTAWYPRPGDAVNQGGASWFEIHLRGPATIHEIRIYGERANSGYDYLAGKFQLFDADGVLLWDSGVVEMPEPANDAVVEVPAITGAVHMRFISVEDVNTHPGIADLQVWGELEATLFVPVTLSKAPITDIEVSYATVDGSAVGGEDFTPASGSLHFPIGSLRREIPLAILSDDLVEFDEIFGVELFDPVEGLLLDAEAEVTIRDEDRMALNGSADFENALPGCVVLTPDVAHLRGSAWSNVPVDLSQSFDKTFRVHLGTRAGSAGAGMYFALQNTGPTALGAALGFTGIEPSVGVRLDTDAGTYDLMSVDTDGIMGNGTPSVHMMEGVRDLADGTEHELRVVWNTAHETLDVHFDGVERIVDERDLVAEVFAGDPSVQWGFTAETYGRRDLQYFCPTDGWCEPGVEPLASVGDVTRAEGDLAGGSTVMSFPVTLSCPSDDVVTVSYATVDGTAKAGSDYQAASGQVTFLPGETSKQVEVIVLADVELELTETFSMQLSASAGATLQHGEAVGTIEADDWGSGVTEELLIEDELSRSYYVVPVDLFVVPTAQVRIDYRIVAGTATANLDFVARNSYLTFNAGQRVANLRIDIIGDSVVEGDETLHVDFSSSSGLIEPHRVTFTLVDDDECPSPNLLINPGADELVDGELPGWTEVVGDLWTAYRRVGTPDGSTNHFFPGIGLVPFAELRQDVDVSGYARVIDAGEQAFVFQGHVYSLNQAVDSTTRILVEYRNAVGAVLSVYDSGEAEYVGYWEAIGDARLAPPGTRTIRVRLLATDYDQSGWNEAYFDTLHLRSLRYPSIILDDVAGEEGDVGERSFTVPVRLTCPGPLPIRFQYLTADGSATAGIDYRPVSGEVTIPAGAMGTTLAVPVIGDTVVEGDETFSVQIHSSVEAGIGDGRATVTIVEDESRMSIADLEVLETAEGEAFAIFTVTLDRPSEADISAHYATSDGTAMAGEDYRQASGTVRFYAGSVEETITVSVFGDIEEEADETFFVHLSEPNNVEIEDGEAVGTILQDDIAIEVGNATVLEGNVATTFVTFNVDLAVPSSTFVSVDWATAEATATAGEDYESASGTLTFQPGEMRRTVAVVVYGDALREGSETFFVRLSNPVNGNLRIAEGTGIIIDDDDCPSPNLLRNPSSEIAPSSGVVPFWTEVGTTGWSWRKSSPSPIDGEAYFASSGGSEIELYQEVSVATYAAYIDAGLQRFSFEGFARSRVEAVPDLARIVVEYRDESGTVLEALDSGEIASTAVWQPVGDLRLAPAGTRSIRVRLLGRRVVSGGVEVYFDGLGLRSVGTPVLLPSDVEVNEGDEASVDAVFAIDLLCPSDERTITLDYATRDRSAVAESDYVPIQGSLTFLPGEAGKTLLVETLGDYRREVSETFYLDFSNVVNAVVLYPYATGTLVDDDPGNAPVPPSFGSDVIYTFDEDFELGYLVSVQHDDPKDDQLQLSKTGSTFPFIWIAASSRGTIVKIDTRSGEILGEFSTSPDNRGSNPSRTTVMLDGSVWVTNRNGRSIAHVGLQELNQCIDRNGNGMIDTSTGYADVLPWPNRNAEDDAGGVTTAEDECLLHFVPTTASGTRHISIRDENSIWVSGTSGRQFDLVDTNSGEILSTEVGFGCGGYGGLTDQSGVVWSSSGLLRWDPSVIPPTAQSKRCISAGAYGLAVDSHGWVWASSGSQVRKISPDGTMILGPFPHGNPGSQGLAVDGNDDVWVSSSLGGGHTSIGHLKNDGTLLGTVFGVPDGPTGIAVDSRGFIWSANYSDSSASRIDPTKGPIGSDGVTPVGEVDLVVPLPGSYPYNYSDMTGFVALQATSRRGTWTVIQDAGVAGAEWGRVSWNSEPEGNVPDGATLIVEARVSDSVIGLGPLAWSQVENGVDFETFGRYLQVRVTLQPNTAGDSPVLSDLRIALALEGEVSIADQIVTEGTGGTTPVQVLVTLVEPALREVVAAYATVNGRTGPAAEAGVDYVAQSGTVVFEPGQTEAILTFEVIGDDLQEETETFEVDLFDLFNGVFLDSVGVVTILDDDLAADPELQATKVDNLGVDADGDGVPSPGDTVEYTITVDNIGEGEATAVIFRDLVPTNTTLIAGSVSSEFGIVVSEDPIEVDLGTLDAGTSATVSFQVVIDSPFPLGVDEISNQATVESAELPTVLSDDPDVGGDIDPTVTMVTAKPRLVAEKVDALANDADLDGVPSPGDTVEYIATLRNLGNTAATGVGFGDITPQHTTYVAGSATTSVGTIDSEDPLQVVIGELAVGDEVTITFQVLIDNPIATGVTQIENQGIAIADGLDDVPTDDPDVGGEADPTITVISAEPVLTVEKTDTLFADANSDGVANPGDELLYRVEVTSSGNTGATSVALSDALEPNLALVPGTVQTDTGAVVSEDPVAVDLGTLEPGTVAVVTLRATVEDPFPFDGHEVSNQATVSSAELDPVLSDDPDTEPLSDPTVTPVLIPAELSIDDVTVTEGDVGTTDAAFTVGLSNATNQAVTLSWVTSDGDATGGVDYSVTSGSLTIPAGDTSATILVPVIGDLLDENDETFTLSLSTVTGAVVVDGDGLGTILDDDEPPVVSIADVTVTEGDPGDTVNAILAVTLDRPSSFDITVSFQTADGEAIAGFDYQAGAGALLIPAGQTAASVVVSVLPDLLDEPDETFTVQLMGVQNTILGDPLAVGTILDDDLPPDLQAIKVAALHDDLDGDGVPSPGDAVEYTITVANVGGGVSTDVLLRDLVPTNTSMVAGSVASDVGTVISEEPIEVDLGALDAGTNATVTFQVMIDSPFPLGVDEISNQATVESAELPTVLSDDPDVGGDVDPTVTMVTAAPRLVAEKVDALANDADSDGVPSPGDTIEYTVSLRNLGNQTATGVGFADVTPEHTTYVAGSAMTSSGTVDGEDPLQIVIGELPVTGEGGDGVTITFQVQVDNPIATGVTQIENQGIAIADGLDDVPTDDPDVGGEADPTITVISAEPVLTVEKTDTLFADANSDGAANPGDELLYRVEVTSSGNTGATSVALSDALEPNLALVPGAVQTDTGAVVSEDPVAVDLGTLEPGTVAVVTLRATVEDPFPFDGHEVSNQATVSSAELDPVLSDDPDTEPLSDPTVTPVLIPAELSIDDVTVTEGDVGTTDAAFTVGLSNATNQAVTLSWVTSDGDATGGVDYSVTSGSLTIPAGDTSATILVPVIGDLLDENDETFTVALSDVTGAAVIDGEGLGTILDDDEPPTVSIADVTVTEGDPPAVVDAVFALTLDRPSSFDVMVSYQTADAEALAGLDYETTAGTLLVPAGQTAASVVVSVLGDLLDEPVETFTVRLTGLDNAVFGDPLAVGTILDDDEPPAVSIDDVTVQETDGQATFTLTLSGPSGRDISLSYATLDQTAVAGADYAATGGTIEITVGDTAATVPVGILDDASDEPDETFTVQLTNLQNAVFGDPLAMGTILDGDPPPSASLGDVSVIEGDDGVSDALFPLTLSIASGFDIQLTYATTDGAGTAKPATAGSDYLAQADLVVVPAGTSSATLAVPVLGELLDELDEAFTLTLSEPVHVTIADGEGIGTIHDDDEALLGIDDQVVEEGDEGGTFATFTVDLTNPSDREIEVSYDTREGGSDDLATEGEDYADTIGQVIFPPGEQEAEVPVRVFGDRLFENDETFEVHLIDPVNAGFRDPLGLGTILDDEMCLGPNLVVNGSGEKAPVDGELVGWTEVAGTDWTVGFDVPDAADGDAYLVSASDEVAELAQDIGVSAYGPRIDAGTQEFELGVYLGQGDFLPPADTRMVVEFRDVTNTLVLGTWDSDAPVAVGTWQHEFTSEVAPAGTRWIRVRLLSTATEPGAGVVSNLGHFDGVSVRSIGAPAVWVDDVTVYETDGLPAVFPLHLACPIDGDTSVQAATADGTAITPDDYETTSATITFPKGETEAELPVPIVQDDVEEPEEEFSLDLSNLEGPYEPVLLDPQGIGSILDARVCSRSPGYWKNHTEVWPVQWLRIGDQVVDAAGLLEMLQYGGPDASSTLARQLVAAKLNLASGSDPVILPTVGAADAFLTLFPPGSDPRGADRSEGLAIKDDLDTYNNLDCEGPDPGSGGGGGGGNGGGGGGNGGGSGVCAHSPGYWKTHHPESWPVFELDLGGVSYNDAELLVFLDEPASDASLGLAHHLVATKLNLAAGSDPSIQQTVDEADAFLVEHPPGSNPKGQARQLALALKDSLDAYNNAPCP